MATVAFFCLYFSVFSRRFQDIGASGWLSKFLSGVLLLVYCGSIGYLIWLILESGLIGVYFMLFSGKIYWYLLIPVSIIIISLISGQAGSNQHGMNPSEMSLCPGESWEIKDENHSLVEQEKIEVTDENLGR